MLPVYGDFLGCVVGPGAQDVVFRFEPPRMRAALALSALCGVAAALWCAAIGLRGRGAGAPGGWARTGGFR